MRLGGARRTCTDSEVREEARNELVVRVSVIGLPNCGKSTLVNQLMKQKVIIIGVHVVKGCCSCLQYHRKSTLLNKEQWEHMWKTIDKW